MSSAGSPSHPGHKRDTAEKSRHWRTSLRPGPPPWWTPAAVEAAQEQLLPAEYRRLVSCEWAEGEDSLTTPKDLRACVGNYRVLEPVPRRQYVLGLDVGIRRDATCLSVGHLETGPAGRKVVIDAVTTWSGSRTNPVSPVDVQQAVVATSRRYGRAKLVFDFHQAAMLTEQLRSAAGCGAEYVFSVSGINRLARALHGAIRDRGITLPDDDDLLAELESVKLVETGAGFRRSESTTPAPATTTGPSASRWWWPP